MMDNLTQITQDILACQRCELRMNATRPVPGHGEIGAKYFIIGESPGSQEDALGVPFIGPAGRKLDKLLNLAGIDINDCFLTNTIRCQPYRNRDPKKVELKTCAEFLFRELAMVQPQTIITLGRYALGLFGFEGISKLHGTQREIEYEGQTYNLITQYHPSAADGKRARLWADILEDWEHLPEKVPSDFKVVDSYVTNEPYPLAAVDTEKDGSGGLGQWSMAGRDKEGQLCVISLYGSRPEYRNYLSSGVWAMHNAKYDLRELKANGIEPPRDYHCTMIAAYCLGLGKQAPKDSSKTKSGSDMVGGLGLKYLARRHLGMEMNTWLEVKDNLDLVPEYNAKDSVATYLLAEKWLPILPKHYFEIDMPLLPVLMAMEDRGVQIDPAVLVNLGKELDNRLADFDETVQHFAFHNIDFQSYLYGALGLEPWKFTDTGQPAVEAEVLEVIDDPVVQQVLEYKRLYKEKGTYVENYINAVDTNNRIHPEIKQTSTSTSRLSCARPNLQNVFKQDERVKLRALFCAPEGKKIIRADYNQLDFRTLAAITQDPTIIEALNADKKIHQVVADEMNITYDRARNVNYGTMFGQEAWGLSQMLHITIGEAKAFLKRYFERFPNIGKYCREMTEIAKTQKKVTIPYTNRTRRIDAMYVEQWRVQAEGVKEAINMPVQGLEAEVVKIGMIDLHQKHSAPMILQIHDELLFEVDEREAVEYAYWLKDYIPTIVEFGGMRFPVEVGIGQNWYEAMENKID